LGKGRRGDLKKKEGRDSAIAMASIFLEGKSIAGA